LFLERILLLRVIVGAYVKTFSCSIHIIRKYKSEINEKRDSNCKVNKKVKVNTRALIYELLDFPDPVLDHLRSRHWVGYVHKMLKKGTGVDRQLAVFEQTKSLAGVAEYIQTQFLAGI